MLERKNQISRDNARLKMRVKEIASQVDCRSAPPPHHMGRKMRGESLQRENKLMKHRLQQVQPVYSKKALEEHQKRHNKVQSTMRRKQWLSYTEHPMAQMPLFEKMPPLTTIHLDRERFVNQLNRACVLVGTTKTEMIPARPKGRPTKKSHYPERVMTSNPALMVAQSFVQSVMQVALNFAMQRVS